MHCDRGLVVLSRRKVYLILTAQMCVTNAVCAVFVFVKQVRHFALEHRELFYVALALNVSFMLMLQCCTRLRWVAALVA